MQTLYIYDPRYSVHINQPTTFTYCEATYAAAAAVRRGRAYELWENGRMVAKGGPSSSLASVL
jgi:hypothetical protein